MLKNASGNKQSGRTPWRAGNGMPYLNDIKALVDIGYLIKDADDVLSIPASAKESLNKIIDIMKKHNRDVSKYS